MCLDYIVPNAVLPKGEVYGWKIFVVHGKNVINFPFYRSPTKLLFNRWLTATKYLINYSYASYNNPPLQYETGFHVYRRREDARKALEENMTAYGKVYKVRIKQIRLLGIQDGLDCYVADKLLVSLETTKKGKTSLDEKKQKTRKK